MLQKPWFVPLISTLAFLYLSHPALSPLSTRAPAEAGRTRANHSTPPDLTGKSRPSNPLELPEGARDPFGEESWQPADGFAERSPWFLQGIWGFPGLGELGRRLVETVARPLEPLRDRALWQWVPDAALEGRLRMRLGGTLVRSTGAFAAIDGRWYRVGETVGAWRVAAITRDSVTLRRDGEGQTLSFASHHRRLRREVEAARWLPREGERP